MELNELRNNIDQIDKKLVSLFVERMQTSADVAKYKAENNLPILDKTRERELLNRIASVAGEDMERYAVNLYATILNLSRCYQSQVFSPNSPLSLKIQKATADVLKKFPIKAVVACQGVEGSYGQQACDRIFPLANVMYFRGFDGVFHAVEKGMCEYGILPVENSSAGSVTAVYDLMEKYNFHIVRSVKLRIDHALLAKKGVALSDIKEIVSHEQAFSQCSEFFEAHPEIKATVFENTAAAARYVAQSDRTDLAAISSKTCAELYGLSIITENIQNSDNNYTRFICIAKDLEIYTGANKISVMLTLNHQPGALYSIIAKFAALGLNLTKLESRPIPGKDFEFRFYFDFSASIYEPEVIKLLCELENETQHFVFLGSYTEIF